MGVRTRSVARAEAKRRLQWAEYERRRDGEAAKREPSSTANTDETSDIHTK